MVGLFVLLKTQRDAGVKMLTDDEVQTAERFMGQNGLSFDQAFQYFYGVDLVERLLHLYKERESGL